MTQVLLRVYLSPDRPLGPGKIKILESIRDGGSISGAARGMRMSYRSAWLLVDSMNSQFKAARRPHDHRRTRWRVGHADGVWHERDSTVPCDGTLGAARDREGPGSARARSPLGSAAKPQSDPRVMREVCPSADSGTPRVIFSRIFRDLARAIAIVFLAMAAGCRSQPDVDTDGDDDQRREFWPAGRGASSILQADPRHGRSPGGRERSGAESP